MGIAQPRPVVIGISGASCSGKTWLAHHICSQRPDQSENLDLDGYYRDLEHVAQLEHGHDNPDSVDFDRALEDLLLLKNGQAADLPVYCYETHCVKSFRTCHPRAMIVIEGLFIFAHPKLRDEIDVKIWMETRDDLRLERRIDRDTSRRERTIDEIQDRYARDVVPGYHKFIHPLRQYADVIVGNEGRNSDAVPLVVKLLWAYAGGNRQGGLPR